MASEVRAVDVARPAFGAAPVGDDAVTGGPKESPEGEGPTDDRAARAAPWVATTYFAEGLPYSIVNQVASEYLTAMRTDLVTLGLTSLYHLPWNFKFAWAPFVDRLLGMRTWLIVMQLLVGLLTIGLSFVVARGDMTWFFVGLGVIAMAAATHDIAIDGFYLVSLGKRDQASLSGMRVAAYKIALMVGKGALVTLGGIFTFFHAFAAAGAVLVILAVVHMLVLPAVPRAATPPRGEGLRGFLAGFVSYLSRKDAGLAIALLLTYRAGDALMFAMNSPFLRDLGLGTEMRGIVSGGIGNVASILGGIIGGFFIARRGLARTLFPIVVIQGFAILLYVMLAVTTPSVTVISVVVVIERLVEGFGTAGLSVFLMRRSRGDFPATHFAVGSALASLASTGAGVASGFLAQAFGYTVFFTVAFLVTIPGMILASILGPRCEEPPATVPAR